MRYSVVAGLACAAFLSGLTTATAQVAPTAPSAAPSAPATAPEPASPEAAPPATASKPKPKPKPKGPTPPQALTLVNASANTALDVIVSGENKTVTLGKKLAPKARATLDLPALTGCTVSVLAMFEGGGQVEVDDFDVCKEKSIRFTQ